MVSTGRRDRPVLLVLLAQLEKLDQVNRQPEFRLEVLRMLRLAGCSQKQLARAIGYEPATLSHKLTESRRCYLTRSDTKLIIKALVKLDVIWFRDEVTALLEIAGCPDFSKLDWSNEPLLSLEFNLEHKNGR